MTIVRKLLNEKPDAQIYSVASTATVLDALNVMNEANTGAVLVSEGNKIIGIYTERDYARQGEVKGRVAKDTLISEVMTKEMVMVKPETSARQCAELMARYHVRHLPVIENERVIGVVSLRRLAEALVEEQKGTITELENYIMGTGYGR
ncbi:MAG TPA: CBS domain-containing protein [Anaerolineales bacterium]|jgi:CBS domain-containing protein